MTIITGGAGFIGSHLVDNLVARGEHIRVIEKPGAPTDHLPKSVEVVFADIRDAAAIRAGVEGADIVYHLAANPNLWARDPREFEQVNHIGTVNVLDAAISAGARRILHCSTESILTGAHAKGMISEDVEVSEADAVGPYCLSKLRAENAARARAAAGHPVLIANPTMPVGPGDRGLSPPTRLIRDFCHGRLPAIIEASFNLVDVRDVAQALRLVVERGQPGRRYLLGGTNLTLHEMLTMLSKRSGQPVPRWRVPYPVALMFAQLSEFWARYVSRRPPQATSTGVRLTRRSMEFDCTHTRMALNWQPGPIEPALAATLTWLFLTGQVPAPIALANETIQKPL